jgi:hypothetical protein
MISSFWEFCEESEQVGELLSQINDEFSQKAKLFSEEGKEKLLQGETFKAWAAEDNDMTGDSLKSLAIAMVVQYFEISEGVR